MHHYDDDESHHIGVSHMADHDQMIQPRSIGKKRPLQISPTKSDCSNEENNNLKPTNSALCEPLSPEMKRKRYVESPVSSEVVMFLIICLSNVSQKLGNSFPVGKIAKRLKECVFVFEFNAYGEDFWLPKDISHIARFFFSTFIMCVNCNGFWTFFT